MEIWDESHWGQDMRLVETDKDWGMGYLKACHCSDRVLGSLTCKTSSSTKALWFITPGVGPWIETRDWVKTR
jgi:hypothetical protein